MILDMSKPYCELGNQPRGNADFVFQEGVVFGWSESNMQYEEAWWLYASSTPLVEALRVSRPFPGLDNINITPDKPDSRWIEPKPHETIARLRTLITEQVLDKKDNNFSLDEKG